jgi:DNA-directed RNA polymerase specialized sigma24 family protein
MLWHEQVERPPQGTSFALGCTPDEAREAIQRADELVRQAEVARIIVRAQAAFALKDSGMSVREIAGAINVSKSTVGRELRNGHFAYALAPGDSETVIAAARSAWGREGSGR